MSKPLAITLYLIVIIFLVISAIAPEDRLIWIMEVSWVILGLTILGIYTTRGGRISNILAITLFFHALLLIYGGWYTYEKVPLGFWLKDLFGFARNHYDRIGHIFQGFSPAFLYREILIRCNVVKSYRWRELIVFAFVMWFSALFELLEFAVILLLGNRADAFLGMQGDIWDTQWDMLLCCLGGLFNIFFFSKLHEKSIKKISEGNS